MKPCTSSYVEKIEDVSFLTDLINVSKVLAPTVVALSLIATVFHFAADINGGKKRKVFLLTNCMLRNLIFILAFTFFFMMDALAKHFHSMDPGFPVSWPTAVRKATRVEVWLLGPVLWVLASMLQFVALLFDFCAYKRMSFIQ